MCRTRWTTVAYGWAIALVLLPAPVSHSAGGTTERGVGDAAGPFFRSTVRPILAEHCWRCHGPGKQKGKLRLDSRAGMTKGGESGSAIVPGDAEASLLIRAIRYDDDDLQMPPDGKLPADAIAAITKWVVHGAVWPKDEAGDTRDAQRELLEEGGAFWSFQPVRRPAVPRVADDGWSRNPIDRFIFRRLDEQGLTPADEADRRALIRRVHFDLFGLPPSPEAIDAFLADRNERAYERLVDRMLSDPRYGERWARHWLDLVRYADSDGYKQDDYRPDAWRYRDYVIRSLNEDKPYDRFVQEQLAGDEIGRDEADVLVATGFLRHWPYEYNQRNVRQQWSDILDDVTNVTGEVFLGFGVGCARCHDHKFDPILRTDYYRLRAFFAPLWPRDDVPLATPEQRARHSAAVREWEDRTAGIRAKITAIEKPYLEKLAKAAIIKFPEDIQAMIAKASEARTPAEAQLADLAYRQVILEQGKVAGQIKGDARKAWDALQKELSRFESLRPAVLPAGFVVTDVGRNAPPTRIPDEPAGGIVEPGFLSVLDAGPASIAPVADALNSTGRRTALARWLTSPANPLTARVMVNRIWQYHFGRGIVGTANDFGKLGQRPSHPELLDWLASTFIEGGWRLKRIHRLILTSSTYRQSSARPAPKLARANDPGNRRLWRMNVRRLSAEPIRDATLAVSGELDPRSGGPGTEPAGNRRSIYTKMIRNKRHPLLDAFDLPDGFSSCARRNVTTTAPQALYMINGDWTLSRAAALARRLMREAADDAQRIRRAYRLAFGRLPTPAELQEARAFLKRQGDLVLRDARAAQAGFIRPPTGTEGTGVEISPGAGTGPADSAGPGSEPWPTGGSGPGAVDARVDALGDLCHVLMNASEFLYVD